MHCSRCSTSHRIGISTVASIVGVVPWIFPNYLNKKFLKSELKIGITALCSAVVYSQVAGALSPGIAGKKLDPPSFANKKINERNIDKLPSRVSGVLPDNPGHPPYRDLIHILAPYKEGKHQLIKGIEDYIDTLLSRRSLQLRHSSALNVQEAKIVFKQLILFLRESDNEKYRKIFVDLIEKTLNESHSFQEAFDKAMVKMKQLVLLPQLPEGPPPLQDLLTIFERFCKGLTDSEDYYEAIKLVLNSNPSSNILKVHENLRYILVKLGDPMVPDEFKQRVLMDLGDKFSSCMPSWVEESRAVLEQLFQSAEKFEDLLLRMAKTNREQIVLQFADEGQWHVLNYLRGSNDFHFGLDPNDIQDDWYRDRYVVKDIPELQEKCLRAYTVEALVHSVYSQLMYCSGKDTNRMMQEILYPFVEEHPELYGGQEEEFWETGAPWIQEHLLQIVPLGDKGNHAKVINLQGVAYMLEAIGLITDV